MSGSRLAIVQGSAGMRYCNDELSFKPSVPRQWQGYNFEMNNRGHLLEVAVDDEAKLRLLSGPSLKVKVYDRGVLLEERQEECLKV